MRLILALLAGTALTACASTPTRTNPEHRAAASAHAKPETGARRVAQSPTTRGRVRVDPIDTLRLCAGSGVRYTGPIGPAREVMIFAPFIDTPAGPLLRNPTDRACLTSGFGWRELASGGGRHHRGLDLARPESRGIKAAGDGVVTASGWNGGYGLMVKIDHGFGVETIYAHLDPSQSPAPVGRRVEMGQVIGKMGTTGNSTGVHLHFEVLIGGQKVDPLRFGAPDGLDSVF